MAEVETKAEVVETEATQPELAEEEKVEASEENSEENAETEEAACKKKEKAEEETAAVVTREYHDETHVQVAYDTETGKEIRQSVTISTETSDVQEGTLVETVDGVHVAEAEVAAKEEDSGNLPSVEEVEQTVQTEEPKGETPAQTETPAEQQAETPAENTNSDNPGEQTPEVVAENKKTAEEMIAELMDIINGLKTEIAELKEQKHIAEAKPVVGEINPFMGDINATGKYSLLEKASKTTSYSLLEKV
jgi:hypothetical protein